MEKLGLTSEMRRQLRSALTAARGRARKRNQNFDLTMEYLESVWMCQAGRCALSGLKFHNEVFSDVFVKKPFAPSIDRIDCLGHYMKDNIQLVCTAVNFARGQWGDDVLRQIAYGIVETEKNLTSAWWSAKTAALQSAEALLATLEGSEKQQQQYRIAGLKATITKGPSRLRSAARRASKQRKQK